MNNDQTIPVPERLLKLAIYHLEDGDWGSTAHELRKHLPQPRTVQDVVTLFEGRAESERAAGDTTVADVWQQAADMLWTTLGGEPAPLPKPEDCEPGEAWLVEADGSKLIGVRNDPGHKIPWHVVAFGTDYFGHEFDSNVTILARLTPDRSVEK